MPSSNKGLVLATLGFHMHNVGDLNAALQNLNRVLQIDPDFRDARVESQDGVDTALDDTTDTDRQVDRQRR